MPKDIWASAVILERHGPQSGLHLRDVTVLPPGPGELRVRHLAIGVNYHEIYVRTGLYKTLQLPGIPGLEADGSSRMSVRTSVTYKVAISSVIWNRAALEARTLGPIVLVPQPLP